MKYKSEIINEIIETSGHVMSTLHYQSECVETWIEEIRGAYPKLTDYDGEWLNYYLENTGIGEFPYLALTNITSATVDNCVPINIKSAILKGSTKYRDIDTGEFLETFEEDRNLELVSVQMPVLTTTGVNVFSEDNTMEYGAWASNGIGVSSTSEIRCKNKHTPFPKGLKNGDKMYIVLSDTSINSNTNMHVFDENKKYLSPNDRGCTVSNFVNGVAVVSINDATKCGYFSFRAISSNINCEFALMINECVPYEPHQSNILTVNEPVELRGIGEVQDTLDCLTGEVTQRIGEIVLDGSDDEKWVLGSWWNPQVETMGFEMPLSTKADYCVVDKIMHVPFDIITAYDNEYLALSSEWQCLGVRIKRTKLPSEDITGFKTYLSQNPITVQYELATESIKTVDVSITNQRGEALNNLNGIEGTMHIETASETIKPLLDIEVPVEAITQNLNSFIEGE